MMNNGKHNQDIEQLRYRSALLEAQNEATPDGILVVNERGEMIYHNQRFVEMWKIPKKILNSKDDTAALRFGMSRVVDPETFMERVLHFYRHPNEVSHEEIHFKDGQILDRYGVPVKDDSGHVYGFAWYFRDITESKKYEQAIIRQNEYLEALHETAVALGKRLEILPLLDSILEHASRIADTSDGYIYLVNETNSEIEVKVGKGVFKDYLHFKLTKGKGLSGMVWKSGKPLVVDDYNKWSMRSMRFPPSLFCAVAGFPLFSGREFTGVLAVAHTDPERKFKPEEITALNHVAELASIALENARLYKKAQEETFERKQTEILNQALTEQQERLLEINRSKDEFISLASHQLRTPATGVKQYIGMLLEGYCGELTEAQRRLLMTADDSNERQLNIVNDLLHVAQADAGKITLSKRPTDIVAMIKDIIKEQADTLKKRSQTVLLTNNAPPTAVMADEDRLRMVFENIIDNASKYSPEESELQVIIGKTRTHLSITVKDKGVGIAAKDLPKLFKKFSRIDNPLSASVGGSGLGLYWAQQIIDLHQGSITVNSKVNKGATFTINLPLNLKGTSRSNRPVASPKKGRQGAGQS